MAKRLKYSPLRKSPRGTKLRSPKIICPECHRTSAIKKNVRKHPHLSDVYCACNNVESGHTFVVNMTFSHTLSPSSLASDPTIKTLIDMMSPSQRQIALNLLQSHA